MRTRCRCLLLLLLLAGCENGRWNPLDPQYDASGDPENDWKGSYGLKMLDTSGSVGVPLSMALSGTNLYISYHDGTNYDLRLARSADLGLTWQLSVIDSAGTVGNPNCVVASQSNVYIAYLDKSAAELLKFARSTDTGASWEVAVAADPADGFAGLYNSMALAGAGNVIYIAHAGRVGADGGVLFSKSTDSGESWAAPVVVDNTADIDVRGTSVAASGTNVYIAYTYVVDESDWACKLKVASSTDEGATWSSGPVESGGVIGETVSLIAGSGGTLHLSFSMKRSQGLKLASSTDAGATWTVSTVDSTAYFEWDSSLAVDYAGTLYLSYFDSDNEALKFARLPQGETEWFTTVVDRAGKKGSCGFRNAVATDGNSVYIACAEGAYLDEDLKFAKSLDRGDSW